MPKANKDIRIAMLKKGIEQTQLAEKMGVNKCTISTWLRCELPKDRKEEILKAIKEM